METEVKLKRCSKCGEEKELSAFCKDNGTKDGLYRWCKTCSNKQHVQYYKNNPEKRILYYQRKVGTPEKKQAIAEYKKVYSREYHKLNYDRLKIKAEKARNDAVKQNKKCTNTSCGKIKSINDFYLSLTSCDGYSSQCRECTDKKAKKWRERNKDKIAIKRRIRFEENPEKIREYAREWVKNYRKTCDELQLEVLRSRCRKQKAEKKEDNKKTVILWRKNNPDKVRLYGQKNCRNIRDDLRDSYVREILVCNGFKKDFVNSNKELIEIKRLIIKTKRLCKTLQTSETLRTSETN